MAWIDKIMFIFKRAVSLFIVTLILVHHIILLSYPVSEKGSELSMHYQVHIRKNPALSIFEWINMHFNPASNHLFSDTHHPKPQKKQKNISLYYFKGSNFHLQYFSLLNKKRNIFETSGMYKFLFVQEFLIPPKC